MLFAGTAVGTAKLEGLLSSEIRGDAGAEAATPQKAPTKGNGSFSEEPASFKGGPGKTPESERTEGPARLKPRVCGASPVALEGDGRGTRAAALSESCRAEESTKVLP